MTGDLEAREQNDALIEERLFGRQTPYSAVTRIFQYDTPYDPFFNMMRDALYSQKSFRKLYTCLHELDNVRKVDFLAAADKAEALLKTWIPENAFEENCRLAMLAICDMMRAASALLTALDMAPRYNDAAKCQFEDPDNARAILAEMRAKLDNAILAIGKYSKAHESAIKNIGHSKDDLVRLSETQGVLARLKDLLSGAEAALDRIPLTRFERLLDRAIEGQFIVR